MRKGSQKSPIQPPTKEQLEHQMKMRAKRTLIIESFYPALQEATKTVDEASMLLQATVSLIMEEAMETLRAKKMEEIKQRVVRKLCPDDDRLLQIEKLMNVFDGLSLFETRGHFESMKAVLEQLKIDEMRKRSLNSFNPDWDRYLTK